MQSLSRPAGTALPVPAGRVPQGGIGNPRTRPFAGWQQTGGRNKGRTSIPILSNILTPMGKKIMISMTMMINTCAPVLKDRAPLTFR